MTMHLRTALVLTLGLAACGSDSALEESLRNEGDGFTVAGAVYSFTGAPDSVAMPFEGATVRLSRTGDLIEQPDTLASAVRLCPEGEVEGEAVTDASGSFTLTGLPRGSYTLTVTTPEESGWKSLEYCALQLTGDWPRPFNVYLTAK